MGLHDQEGWEGSRGCAGMALGLFEVLQKHTHSCAQTHTHTQPRVLNGKYPWGLWESAPSSLYCYSFTTVKSSACPQLNANTHTGS